MSKENNIRKFKNINKSLGSIFPDLSLSCWSDIINIGLWTKEKAHNYIELNALT